VIKFYSLKARHALHSLHSLTLRPWRKPTIIESIEVSSLSQQHSSTQLIQTPSNRGRTGTEQVALIKEQMRQHVRRNLIINPRDATAKGRDAQDGTGLFGLADSVWLKSEL